MSKVIWKFPLPIVGRQNVSMPGGAWILSAQAQGDALCLWAEVDPGAALEDRAIEIIGTGNPFPAGNRRFISTAQMMNGRLVWHVFERLT